MNTLTGQYECVHHSPIGLEYFTARIDRLTMQASGRFTLVTQEKSRLANAAQSFISGQQASPAAPEIQRTGAYSSQGNVVFLRFDDGSQQQAEITGNGLQMGKDHFEKVSDSTLLPPTQRMKSNMEDIAKGLKIAGALGSAAIKAAKTLQDTLQTSQAGQQNQATHPQGTPAPQAQTYNTTPPQQAQSYQATPAQPAPPPVQPTYAPPAQAAGAPQDDETRFCDQCGAPVRPGKRFCNQCGARLP